MDPRSSIRAWWKKIPNVCEAIWNNTESVGSARPVIGLRKKAISFFHRIALTAWYVSDRAMSSSTLNTRAMLPAASACNDSCTCTIASTMIPKNPWQKKNHARGPKTLFQRFNAGTHGRQLKKPTSKALQIFSAAEPGWPAGSHGGAQDMLQ